MKSKLPTCVGNLRLLAGKASSPFTLLLALGLTEQGDQKPTPPLTGVMAGQGIQIWAPKWLHVCCCTTNIFPECWQLRQCEELYLFLKGNILLCSEESNLQLVRARFGKWGCLGLVRGLEWNRSSVAKFEKWELLRAVQTDESPECYLLQQPCFWDLVRDFRVRCLNPLEELTLGLRSLNVSCCMDERS